jgi:hypothetical protein
MIAHAAGTASRTSAGDGRAGTSRLPDTTVPAEAAGRSRATRLAAAADRRATRSAHPGHRLAHLTGSLGWLWVCKAQINLSITLIGSKDPPRDGPAPGADAVGRGPAPCPPEGGN